MAVDTGRIEAAVAELLAAIGEDPARPGLEATPRRVAESYADLFAGVGVDPLERLGETVAAGPETGELVLLRDVAFRSMCEHHLLPFFGHAALAYVPSDRAVGLGRLASVVETLSSRPQLQERLTEQIAETLEAGLAPRGVLVVLDARQGCLAARGARQGESSIVTIASRGELSDPAARAEVMALLGRGHG